MRLTFPWMALWPKGGTVHLLVTLTTSSTWRGAMGLLAISFMTTWPSLASTSLINQETHKEAHGTANPEISPSPITPIMQHRVGAPRITSHSIMPGLSITMAIWSSSYPWTQGTLTFIMTNPTSSTEMPPRPDEQDGSPGLLRQIVQGHNVHFLLLSIGRSNEIESSSIVQETGSQLIINKCLTQILRAYEPAKSIRVQIWDLLHFEGPVWDMFQPGRGGFVLTLS